MNRQKISKSVRFEILRRDNFACRYCGLPAGVVQLHIDHVLPVAMGGTNDPANLTAACPDCNEGKRASMPDDSVVMAVRAHEAQYRDLIPCIDCGRPSSEYWCDVCTGISQDAFRLGLNNHRKRP